METNLRIIHDSETSESIHYSKWLFIQSIRDIHRMRRGKFCGYNLFEIAMGLVTGGVKIGLVSRGKGGRNNAQVVTHTR